MIKDIQDCYARGQPVLVGTTSIENSELLSQLLDKEKLPHNVLNAKQHAREAEIVVQAGRPKTITIATNMAGRGTDIVLGGNPEPEISQGRSGREPRRQHRRRAASKNCATSGKSCMTRSSPPAGCTSSPPSATNRGASTTSCAAGRAARATRARAAFYLSLEDPLLRIFASDRVAAIMQRLKMPDGEAIEHPWVTRAIENAQRKVEARNFDMRKHLLEYDDVANDQRKAIYESRNQLLESTDISERITAIRAEVITGFIAQHIPPESLEEQWDIPGLEKTLAAELQLDLPIQQWLADEPDLDEAQLRTRIVDLANQKYQAKCAQVDPQAMRQFERAIMLQSVDSHWREHLAALDHLRQGIHLRSYAQKTPTQEYKKEAFELFSLMLDMINTEVTKILLTVQVRSEAELQKVEEPEAPRNVQYHHADYGQALEAGECRPAGAPMRKRSCATDRKSGATIPAPAARARNTSTATAS